MPPGRKKQKKTKIQEKNNSKDLTNEDEAFDAIFDGDFGGLEINNYISKGNEDDQTEHLPDAVDFEDEDELADEDEEDSLNISNARKSDQARDSEYFDSNDADTNSHLGVFEGVIGTGSSDPFSTSVNDGFGLVMSDSEHSNQNIDIHCSDQNTLFVGVGGHDLTKASYEDRYKLDAINAARENQRLVKEKNLLLKTYFPAFKKGKVLKWNKLFYERRDYVPPARDIWLQNKHYRPLIPLNLKFYVKPDQRRLFRSNDRVWHLSKADLHNNTNKKGIISVTPKDSETFEADKSRTGSQVQELSEDLLIATDHWDQNKILGEWPEKKNNFLLSSQIDEELQVLEWDEEALVEGKLKEANFAELNMNDEQLLLSNNSGNRRSSSGLEPLLPHTEQLLVQKYNISNDDSYNILMKTHKTKVRATVSNLNIEHSQPALRLQSPFYKVTLPKRELRHYRRPNFSSGIHPGSIITFSKLKTRKRKRDKGKDVKESFATSQDLTMGDTAQAFLLEYSEQTPLALSKYGMASKLINYYRKTHEDDTLRPKLPIGETHVLGVQDKSPFWNFGFVEPGQIVPTLYNNMIRAPVFRHDISGTDFLLIRSSGNGVSNRYFIKPINHILTVGQTFPTEEIPGPNSRKVTSMRSTRLRMIVYRILNRSPRNAISIEPIAQHFPDQDYGQNRQKVKEFMKYQREGPDKGLWKLKEGEVLLDNESAKKLITPEQVSEVESMYHGLQIQEDNELYNYDKDLRQLEENLLPWNASRNFINATQMRAMIQIHGPGDPTGCDEAFSFLKTSMKGGFVRGGSFMSTASIQSTSNNDKKHSYNVAQQQRVYDEEIKKTWYVHTNSLNITNPFEEMQNPEEVNASNKNVPIYREDGKVLRIIRKKRDSNGIIQRKTIVVRDPRIIQGYLKLKEKRREANLDVNKLLEEDNVVALNEEDLEIQKKLLQSQLASLEKSQQRRAAREVSRKKQQPANGGSATPDTIPSSSKPKNTSRRCATCGQVGHIRTNKSCPMYTERTETPDISSQAT